jgi:Ni/Co efflux regulator RcnB
MKRIAIMAAAALTLVGPLASTAAYADQPNGYNRDNDRDNDRDNNGRHRRDNDRRRDNDNRRDWDRSRDNGYMYNGRWNYGPPPAYIASRPGFAPGYHAWRRGDRLPVYYRTQYRDIDYRVYRLRPPPRGYHYVRDDRGEILLVGIATGLILSAILSNH